MSEIVGDIHILLIFTFIVICDKFLDIIIKLFAISEINSKKKKIHIGGDGTLLLSEGMGGWISGDKGFHPLNNVF